MIAAYTASPSKRLEYNIEMATAIAELSRMDIEGICRITALVDIS